MATNKEIPTENTTNQQQNQQHSQQGSQQHQSHQQHQSGAQQNSGAQHANTTGGAPGDREVGLQTGREQGNQAGRGMQGGMGRRQPSYATLFPVVSPLMAGDPFIAMNRLAQEMDRLFEGLGMGRTGLVQGSANQGRSMTSGTQDRGNALWSPAVEMFDRDNELVIRADLPGVTKDNVSVDVADGALTIQGERQSESNSSREGYYRSERSYGTFFRSIPLPDGIDAQQAKATFRDGVLEITLPLPKQEGRHQVQIQ